MWYSTFWDITYCSEAQDETERSVQDTDGCNNTLSMVLSV